MEFKAWGPICRACTLYHRDSAIMTFLKVTEWSIWRRFQNTICIVSTQQEKGAGGLGETHHPQQFSTPVCRSLELGSYRRVLPAEYAETVCVPDPSLTCGGGGGDWGVVILEIGGPEGK